MPINNPSEGTWLKLYEVMTTSLPDGCENWTPNRSNTKRSEGAKTHCLLHCLREKSNFTICSNYTALGQMTEGCKNSWHIISYKCIQLQQFEMPLPTATLVQERWKIKYKHSYMIKTGPFGIPWWWSQVLRCLQYFLFSILKIKTYICKYEMKSDLSNVQIVWNLGVTSVWVMGENCD